MKVSWNVEIYWCKKLMYDVEWITKKFCVHFGSCKCSWNHDVTDQQFHYCCTCTI